jgi:hypothetical protein
VNQNEQFWFTRLKLTCFIMKGVKFFLTAAAMVAAMGFVLFTADATSVREFEKMSFDEQVHFLARETDDLLIKIRQHDPALEKKTRAYMLDETNQWGYVKGGGAVLATIDRAEKTRPETLDKLQVETITKVVMRTYWKQQGLTVPQNIFDDPPASTAQKSGNAGQ